MILQRLKIILMRKLSAIWGGLDGEQKQLIKKLVNFRMKEGKRTGVRAIVYQTFLFIAQLNAM